MSWRMCWSVWNTHKARDDVLGSSFRTSMEDTIDLLFRD